MKPLLGIAALLGGLLSTSPLMANDVLPASRPEVGQTGDFPTLTSATRPQGAFVPARNIALVAPGLKKSEVYTLLDVPHFQEGLLGVHRWNYILNFYTGHGDEFRQCQYQIHFDSHYRVDRTWWKDADCAHLFEGALADPVPAVKIVEVPAPAVQSAVQSAAEKVLKTYSFNFAFNRSDVDAEGRKVIAQAVQESTGTQYHRIVVTGFTDTVGGTGYNDGLAARRAAVTLGELTAALEKANSPLAHQVFSRGGRDLAVETGPGVREVRNRRATIEFF